MAREKKGLLEKIFGPSNENDKYAFRLPVWTKTADPTESAPKGKGPRQASGIVYVGTDENEKEIWLSGKDMENGMLVCGAADTAKLAFIQAIAENALGLGTGIVHVNTSGDQDFARAMFTAARRVSREDDFLFIDPSGTETYNYMNPFATASAKDIEKILLAMCEPTLGGEKGTSVFAMKAKALLHTVVRVLVALRDARETLPVEGFTYRENRKFTCVRPDKISQKGSISKDFFGLHALRTYLTDPTFCVSLVYPVGDGTNDGEECAAIARIVDKKDLDALKAALCALCYEPGKDVDKQDPKAFLEQFEIIGGFFHPMFMNDHRSFAHWDSETDMRDCLFNRRILCCNLDSLHARPKDCKSEGRLVLATIKTALASVLEEAADSAEPLAPMPSTAKFPGFLILNDCGDFLPKDFGATVLTQSRSLGLSFTIAIDGYDKIEEKNPEAASELLRNTETKVFMSSSDQNRLKVIDMAREISDAIDPIALMKQRDGEYHLVTNGRIFKGTSPWFVPKFSKKTPFRENMLIVIECDRNHIRENIGKWTDPDFLANGENMAIGNPAENHKPRENSGENKEELTMLDRILSLIPENEGANQVFADRARTLTRALVPIIEQASGPLDGKNLAKRISAYLAPSALVGLVYPVKKDDSIEECDMVAKLVDAPALNALREALKELSFSPEKGIDQDFLDQLGYAKGYLAFLANAG